jgi:putative phosphoesterase
VSRHPRLALVSDQHGNDVAFRAVVEEIERIDVDEIICLGDVVQGGTQPRQTLERLTGLGCRTVLGNADAFLLEIPEASREPLTEHHLEVREWTLSQLSSAQLDQIRAFEPVVSLDFAGLRIVCFHGSPSNYEDTLLPEIEEASLDPYLEVLPADLLAGGHTHRQWTRQIGDALFVNPGSVGLPVGRTESDDDLRIPLHGEYALVVVDKLGLSVEFHRAPYTFNDLEQAAAVSGRPYWRELIAQSEHFRRTHAS